MTHNLKQLSDMKWKADCAKSQMPPLYIPRTTFTDKTSAGLEKCIKAYITLKGGQCERVKNQGRLLDDRRTVIDVLGNSKVIGSRKFIPGTGTNGSADVHSVIPVNSLYGHIGLTVKWEVKIGRDKMSDAQRKYKASIEAAGGYYFEVHNFDEVVENYEWLMNKYK